MEHIIKKVENRIYMGESATSPYAELDYYVNRNGIIIATHTGVRPQYQGQGLAGLLFNELIVLAKELNTTIIPYCSYVASKLNDPLFNTYLYKK